MTSWEYALRFFAQLRPMVPGLAAAAILTFAAVFAIFLVLRRAWLPSRGFALLSFFFGLSFREVLRLACVWLKLLMVCIYAALFAPMVAVQYFTVLLPGLLAAALDRGLWKRLEDLFWLALQTAGLLAANLVCRFLKEMGGDQIFILIYIGMALFLGLFSLYLFLNELSSISQHRQISARRIWSRGEEAS